MAKVKIQGHASGTGILTITAPNTSTDRTITLPDASGALLNSDGDGSSLTGIQSPLVEGTDYLAPDGDGSNLTALDATTLTGNLPAIDGSSLTALDATTLTGNLPAIDGSNLTALDATTLTGNLPAIDGSNLTGVAPTKSVVEALGIDVPATNLTGTVPTARLGSGTANSSVFLSGGGTWTSAAAGLNSVQTFTSGGTWTKPSGVTKVIVEVQGGGGGGGNCDNYPGQGGGSGGYVKKFIDVSSISTATITVGAGATAQTSTGANGNAGGNSSWADGTNTLTGGGGGGGDGTDGSWGSVSLIDNRGTATGGDVNIRGCAGGNEAGARGGDSMFGFGSFRTTRNIHAPDQASGYGSGGNAPANQYDGGNYHGGPGRGGIVIVTEYK